MEYTEAPPSEVARIARDRLRGKEIEHAQLEINELAGDQVDKAAKDKVEKEIGGLRKLIEKAESEAS